MVAAPSAFLVKCTVHHVPGEKYPLQHQSVAMLVAADEPPKIWSKHQSDTIGSVGFTSGTYTEALYHSVHLPVKMTKEVMVAHPSNTSPDKLQAFADIQHAIQRRHTWLQNLPLKEKLDVAKQMASEVKVATKAFAAQDVLKFVAKLLANPEAAASSQKELATIDDFLQELDRNKHVLIEDDRLSLTNRQQELLSKRDLPPSSLSISHTAHTLSEQLDPHEERLKTTHGLLEFKHALNTRLNKKTLSELPHPDYDSEAIESESEDENEHPIKALAQASEEQIHSLHAQLKAKGHDYTPAHIREVLIAHALKAATPERVIQALQSIEE